MRNQESSKQGSRHLKIVYHHYLPEPEQFLPSLESFRDRPATDLSRTVTRSWFGPLSHHWIEKETRSNDPRS